MRMFFTTKKGNLPTSRSIPVVHFLQYLPEYFVLLPAQADEFIHPGDDKYQDRYKYGDVEKHNQNAEESEVEHVHFFRILFVFK
jgi:hypothetical protein